MRRLLFVTSGIPLTRQRSRDPSRFFKLSSSTTLPLAPPLDKDKLEGVVRPSLFEDLGEPGRDREKNLRKLDCGLSPEVGLRLACMASMMTIAFAAGDMDEGGSDEAFV